jgi:hypothetical protein
VQQAKPQQHQNDQEGTVDVQQQPLTFPPDLVRHCRRQPSVMQLPSVWRVKAKQARPRLDRGNRATASRDDWAKGMTVFAPKCTCENYERDPALSRLAESSGSCVQGETDPRARGRGCQYRHVGKWHVPHPGLHQPSSFMARPGMLWSGALGGPEGAAEQSLRQSTAPNA